MLLLAPALMAAGCSVTESVTGRLKPYRMDIREGNFVTQEMAAKLKPGMSRDEVRFALGTPILTDLFHADRWDYLYRFQPGRGPLETRRLTLIFQNDVLARVAGDVVEAEPSETTTDASPRRSRVVEIEALKADKK
ncbi:MAG: outer membrane protein assembly factor BamE [Rhodocyclaceae bacterium]|nr:outer membrane protein assembly factor BamE [Rhodocyclaceae bacterium]